MPTKNSLITSAMSNWFSIAIGLITTFFITPYIIAQLGKSSYGVWVLVISLVGYASILDLGLHSATIRFIAYYSGKNDPTSLRQVINTSITLFSIIGLIIIFLALFLANPLSHFFQLPPEKIRAFKYLIWLVGLSSGISFPRRVFDAVLMGFEKFVRMNMLDSSITLLRALGLFSVIFLGGGLIALGLVEIAVEIINFSAKLLTIKLLKECPKISFATIKFQVMKELVGFGVLMFLILIGDMLKYNIQTPVIGRLLDAESVAVYGIAAILLRTFLRFSSALSVVTFPRLSLQLGHDRERFAANFLRYARVIAVILAGMALIIVLEAKNFIQLWVGQDFHLASTIVVVLAGSLSLDFISMVSVNALKALNRHHYFAIQTLLEGLAIAISTTLLVKKFGLIGAAWGTAIPILLTKLFIQPAYTSKIIGIELPNYLLAMFIRPAIACGVVGSIFYFSGFVQSCSSFLNLIFQTAVIGCAYCVAVLLFCFNPEEWSALGLRIANGYEKLLVRK